MAILKWFFKDRTLGYKFAVLALLPLIMVITFIVYVSFATVERRVMEELVTRAKGITSLSALSASNSYAIYNKGLLDNLVDSLLKEEIVVYAMIVDANDERILAHSDHLKDGQVYNAAEHSFGLSMDGMPTEAIVGSGLGNIFDLSKPVIIDGEKFGLVRMGFSTVGIRQKIDAMKNRVILIAGLAIALGVLLSALLGRIVGRPIRALAKQAQWIGGGDFEQKMIYESKDDIGQLAHSFNDMATQLSENIGILEEKEAKYRALFEHSPIALWQGDFSEVKKHLSDLRQSGIDSLKNYFCEHPEKIVHCVETVRTLDVNDAAVEMYEAKTKENLLGDWSRIYSDDSCGVWAEALAAISRGEPFEIQCVNQTLKGKKIHVLMKSNIPPGYEESWSKVFISMQDLTERVKGEFLTKMFGRYLSEEVMKTLIREPEGLRLGGEKRAVTIMMTDLRGFTAVSERLDPEHVVLMLNEFFEVMVDIIIEYGGTINEIIGDAMLVIFGAPQEMPDRVERAVACAIEMQNAMRGVCEKNRSEGLPPLEMGIGLNDAEVVVGNVGSRKRSKYGVVGSGVNLTGRIESYTVGGQILVSESVREAVGSLLRIDNQLSVHAKGAGVLLTMYEVGGIGGRYNLALEHDDSPLVVLGEEIPVAYTVLEGKYYGEGDIAGAILQLSRNAGELRLDTTPDFLTNIKLNLKGVSGDLSSKNFYGKVLKTSESAPNVFLVRFTALPPEVSSYFQAAIHQAGQKET